jgi:FkbM family methyltransferase
METTNIIVRSIKMALQTDNRSLELCAKMNYETENLDFIDDIPENSVLFDLGACEGRFSIYAALKNVDVYSFEPEQKNFEVLQKNIFHNNVSKNIKTFNVGIGECEKEATLNIGQPWAGGHQKVVSNEFTRQDLNFDFKTSQKIKIVGLDDFIKSQKLPFPSYLKIDIDGSEVPFLKGALETLKKAKSLIFELDEKDNNFEYIIKTLNEMSYKVVAKHLVPNEPSLFNFIFNK